MHTFTNPPMGDPLVRFFIPSHPALAEQYEAVEEKVKLLRQTIQDEIKAALDFRDEGTRRAKRVNSQEGATELNITEQHLLRLRRRGEIKGTRTPGTRRYYFILGDLLDWAKASTREDGGLRYTSRKSAPEAKNKGGK